MGQSPPDIWLYTSTSGCLIAHYGYTYYSDGTVVIQIDSDGPMTNDSYDGSIHLIVRCMAVSEASTVIAESFTYVYNENKPTVDSNVVVHRSTVHASIPNMTTC